MQPNKTLREYQIECCEQLKQNKPESVDDIFSQMKKSEHDLIRLCFIQQFPGCVSNHYLLPVLEGNARDLLILQWENQEPEWPERLKNALINGTAGAEARILRASLLRFVEKDND
ncbi:MULTISPECIES: hypothetical protein [Enterobacter]|uniref:hypothetical protein n=1 Tax=Enterobacter TaxID=547 RepID=UPI000A52AD91|nr:MULTISPECIES: hypothetical protein [Enterobacter]HCD1361663.1 hypothetical protein [Klebsiella pneumoniae subsp. pneumoniae]HDS5941165.1 hypothetical protein [Klebsiella variicola]EKS6582896.1 hypothetical protein [Enterobacter hormaechei]ELC7334057.1 hypothetical protein [Enterobacter hormaechei]ELC7362774.1 hypothetical protein [Enterobacter hormaechei]